MSLIKKLDREFLRRWIKLATPIAVQQMIVVSLGLVDVIMVGQLGEKAVASVGLAEQLVFLLFLLMFGISSGSAIFTAQYWGQKDIRRIRSVLGICLIMSVGSSLLFCLAAITIPERILTIYTTDPEVIALGSSFLRIAGVSYIAVAITTSYANVLRSTEQVKLPMYAGIVALSLNTALNYGLIFGNFGLPQLGVLGAAVSTTISRWVECLLLLAAVYKLKLPAAANWQSLRQITNLPLARYFKTIAPVVLTEMLWSLGVTTYNAIYAHIGTEAIAAVNIANSIDKVLFVIFIALGSASAILIGNEIGAGHLDKATRYARNSILIAPVLALILGVTIIANIQHLLFFYKVSPITATYIYNIVRIMALMLVIRSSNFILLIGVLRSGGDTRFAFFIDAGVIWAVGVPLAFVGAFVFKWPIHGVYMLVMVEEALKLGLGLWRFRSHKWINRLVAA